MKALSVLFALCATAAALGQSTTLTYQGQLKQSGTPANGTFDMAFRVWDSAQDGQAVTLVLPSQVAVMEGLFTVPLDFAATPFSNGERRWLEVSVNGTTLNPRQELTPSPYSITAAGVVDNAVTTPKLADSAVTNSKLAPGAVSTGAIADGAVNTAKLADGAVTSTKLAVAAVTTDKLADESVTAAKLAVHVYADEDKTPVVVSGTTQVVVSSWTFTDVPAGAASIRVYAYGRRTGANTVGRLRLRVNGTFLSSGFGTHPFIEYPSSGTFGQLALDEIVPAFPGGEMVLDVVFDSEFADCGIEFGWPGLDPRVGRKCRIIAGL